MKLLVPAAALLMVSSASTVHAEDLLTTGYWTAFRNVVSGKPVCGMHSNRQDGSSFYIKYYAGNAHLTGQVIKPSWRFPTDGSSIDVPMTIGVDRNPILSGIAIGYTQSIKWTDGKTYQMPTLEFVLRPEKTNLDSFLNDFSLAAKFWLSFDEGSEKPWVLDMTGSAKVTLVFRACTLELINAAKENTPPATQPYGQARPRQPYGDAPSQPYGNPPPTQPVPESRAPMQPKTVKTKPMHRDDGSI